MADLFNNIILCRECGKEMRKETILKSGIPLRIAFCEKCKKKEYHPLDLQRLREFQQIKQKPFRVKLRMVGNSYAVSIPKEIIDFFEDAEKLTEEVEMQFAEFDKLMLSFNQKFFNTKYFGRSFVKAEKEEKEQREPRESSTKKPSERYKDQDNQDK